MSSLLKIPDFFSELCVNRSFYVYLQIHKKNEL